MSLLTRRRTPTAPPPIHPSLATSARVMVANLLVLTDGRVLAGYRIGPVRWDYTGIPAKEALLDVVQDGWAQTIGHTVHERVTTRPHPVRQWAERLDKRTPEPLPDVHICDPMAKWTPEQRSLGECGCETYNKWLARQQWRIATAGMDDKVVLRYFDVGQVPVGYPLREELLAFRLKGTRPNAGVRALLDAERKMKDALSVAGWRAKRMTEREQAWLRHRSLAYGAPAPEIAAGWRAGDIEAISAPVRWHEDPFDRTVTLTVVRGGQTIERAMQVLTCSRLDDLDYPNNGLEPWQVYAERAVDAEDRPFTVEWSISGRIVAGAELEDQAKRDLRIAISQRKAFEGFGEPADEYIDRGIDRAKVVRDQVGTAPPRDSARFVGTIGAVVSGEAVYDDAGRMLRSAQDVCLERAEAVTRLFGGSDLQMHFVAPPGQSAWLNATVPGEAPQTTGFQRQVRLDYLAAGMPNVNSAVGDGHGPYQGYTRGAAPRPSMHDPHYTTEGRGEIGRGADMWVVGGTLGAGKTVVTGGGGYNECRRGGDVIFRDPSGPLLRFGELPEIKPFFNGVDLTQGEDGTLNPPSMIREPRREEWPAGDDGDRKYIRAVEAAAAERSMLTRDIARRTLEYDLYSHPSTLALLREAARKVTWTINSTLWDLVDALPGTKEGKALAGALEDASHLPLLSLLFAPRGQGGDFAKLTRSGAKMTVIATPGIKRAPDNVDRLHWTGEQRAADPVIHLSGLYTAGLVYDKPMAQRAMLVLDEAEDLTDGAVGQAFLTRLGRDHSKWNTAVYLCLKNITDSILGPEMRNYLAGAYVGRMSTRGPAESMLDVLNIEDKEYAKSLMRLSTNVPGEFVHLDADGNVGGLRVDVAYHEALAQILFTNPDQAHGADGWVVEEELG